MNRVTFFVAISAYFFCCTTASEAQKNVNKFNVIAYYSGNSTAIDSYPVEKLTQVIFSFCHLKGNKLAVDNAADTTVIEKLVSLKKRNHVLKVLLSLGGWGGCEFCSPVFATDTGRKEFASSVKALSDYFKTDGIDLDWEYPAISGYPAHAFIPADRSNFTALVKTLRDTLGTEKELSFAAGGFLKYLLQSIEWEKVMPLTDRVNLMSYDLVSGYSTLTGHHTPLYATPGTPESADKAIRYLDSIGVPLNKLVIGAAFYARTWEGVAGVNKGLYQKGKFKDFIGYNQFNTRLSRDSGFIFHHDSVAKASYAYNRGTQIFATFDDSVSIAEKTKYAIEKKLNGIMFWELTLDKKQNGLLDVISNTLKLYQK